MRKSFLLVTAAIAAMTMMAVPTFADNNGWRKDDRGWWYHLSNGAYPISSWLKIKNNWYYMDGSGYMQTGWLKYDGGWYYLDVNNGDMKVGWVKINNEWYYLNPTNGGRLDTNTITPDGYYVDVNGVYKPRVKIHQETTASYYAHTTKAYRNDDLYGNATLSSQDIDDLVDGLEEDKNKLIYEYEDEVISIVNAERAKNGLSALRKDSGLMDTAHLRSKELEILFSHDRPDGTDCFTAFPNGFGAKGENIAKGQTNPTNVMNSWMNSSGHRANILNPSYDSIGVGCYKAGGKLHWVQVFGRSSR